MKKKVLLMLAALSGMSAFAFNGSPVSLEKAPFGPTRSEMTKAPAFAEGESPYVDFTYADEVYTAYSLNGISSGYIYLAFEFTKEDQAAYKGAKIIGMTVTTGTNASNQANPITRAQAFVTDDISVYPEKMTAATFSSNPFSDNYVELSEPVEITGDAPLYCGYNFRYVANSYYIPTDDKPVPVSEKTCLVGVSGSLKGAPEWMNLADQCGSVCISIRISGDNLPDNVVSLKGITCEPRYELNKNGVYELEFKNTGLKPVSKLVVKTDLSNGSSFENTLNFPSPVASGAKGTVNVSGIMMPDKAAYYTLSTTVKEVNSEAVDIDPASTQIMCYNDGFDRKILLEEATGNWCPNCPLGIVALDYLEANFPDWITIAVHGPQTYNEPMSVPGYQGLLNDYGLAFPQVLVNRTYSFGFNTQTPKQASTYKPYQDYYTSFPAYADVDFDCVVSADESSVAITSNTEFALAGENKPHAISFVIVEDNVGPYDQSNNLTGVTGDLDGWNQKGGNVSTKYNHVARAISSYPGDTSAIPATFSPGVKYRYDLTMPLKYSYGLKPNGMSGTDITMPFKLVAIITDTATGEVVNAKAMLVDGVGVKSMISDNDNVNVRVAGGNIIVEGTDNYNVYTLDGRRVNANGVSAGIYLVKTDAGTFKILVK